MNSYHYIELFPVFKRMKCFNEHMFLSDLYILSPFINFLPEQLSEIKLSKLCGICGNLSVKNKNYLKEKKQKTLFFCNVFPIHEVAIHS